MAVLVLVIERDINNFLQDFFICYLGILDCGAARSKPT